MELEVILIQVILVGVVALLDVKVLIVGMSIFLREMHI